MPSSFGSTENHLCVPYRGHREHDILRVKGGNHDHCIAGEVDVLALRQFQSTHRSATKDLTPVSDGFNQNMARTRKVLPKGE